MKTTALILLLILFSYYTQGQVSYGVKGGVNLNTYKTIVGDGGNAKEYNYNGSGFHLGGYVKIPFGKKIGLIPELQFTRRGGDTFSISYIELPLMISYLPHRLVAFDFGFNTAYFISGSRDNFPYNKFDFGLIGGFRFNITSKISFISRYYYGITPAYYLDNSTIKFVNPPDVNIKINDYNRTIQLGIGYKIK